MVDCFQHIYHSSSAKWWNPCLVITGQSSVVTINQGNAGFANPKTIGPGHGGIIPDKSASGRYRSPLGETPPLSCAVVEMLGQVRGIGKQARGLSTSVGFASPLLKMTTWMWHAERTRSDLRRKSLARRLTLRQLQLHGFDFIRLGVHGDRAGAQRKICDVVFHEIGLGGCTSGSG